jgi:hypothetical protein
VGNVSEKGFPKGVIVGTLRREQLLQQLSSSNRARQFYLVVRVSAGKSLETC